ncbi:ribonuclease III [Orrella sp. 11846]|uniref:ribonuclease III n=1 Tax=Orrella sp. 11846 TaxID=3409913 RepID=UPI003B5A4D83
MKLSSLQKALGYAFADISLLQQALTHRSVGFKNNERLEFLGDAILDSSISDLLYHQFIGLDEGDLSRIRASLVKKETLADLALELKLSDFLKLGEGELKSGGFRRPSILADAFEAILGAIYLDGGFEAAHQVIARLYTQLINTLDPKKVGKDAKTYLQEYLQARKMAIPVYRVLNTRGVAHEQLFDVVCEIQALNLKVGATGPSRRAAEQCAAQDMMALILRETEQSDQKRKRK